MAEDSSEKEITHKKGRFNFLGPIQRGFLAATVAMGSGAGSAKPIETFKAVHRTIEDPGKYLEKFVELVDPSTFRAPLSEFMKGEKGEVVADANEKVIGDMFPGLTAEEKSALGVELLAQRRVLIGDEQKGTSGALDGESFKTLAEVEPILEDIEKTYGVPRNLMAGLIFCESQGKRGAVSKDGAIGLTQIMEPIRQKHNLPDHAVAREGEDQHELDKQFLQATAAELGEYFRVYNGETGQHVDWGLPVWEWHTGRTNVYEGLQQFAEKTGRVKMETPDEVNSSNAPEADVTAIAASRIRDWQGVIKGNKQFAPVNVFSVLHQKDVREYFSGSKFNDTLIYDFRVAAGATIYNDFLRLVEQKKAEAVSTQKNSSQ